jgi:hypothetical protein
MCRGQSMGVNRHMGGAEPNQEVLLFSLLIVLSR